MPTNFEVFDIFPLTVFKDKIEISNLGRQIIFQTNDINKKNLQQLLISLKKLIQI